MRAARGFLMGVLCALAGSSAWAAVEVEQGVDYLRGAQPADMACAWEASMVSAIAKRSSGFVMLPGRSAAGAGLRLSLQVAQLTLSAGKKKSEYSVIVRANVMRDGKLVATRDFQGDESFKNEQPACNALQTIGTSIGESAADWAAQTRLIDCRDDCTGIHPDETIVVGPEVLVGKVDGEDAISDSVRDDCKWPSSMMKRVVEEFNDRDDPPPRAKLESRPIDIEKYAGRRLVLRVNDMHAIGGGSFSGIKYLAMSGELREGKILVASFDSYVSSARGFSTCGAANTLSDDTTEMIVRWLRSPSLGAQLR